MELVQTPALTQLPFADAAKAWLETRRAYLSLRTFSDYAQYITTLDIYFHDIRLQEITPDQIRAYQRMRMTRAGASRINQECCCLQQMLKRIGRWEYFVHDYQPLPKRRESPGRALSPNERARLFDTARRYIGWEMAYLFALISVNTTAGPKEAWTLRHQDIDLVNKLIRIQPEGAKNIHRIRVIPLNEIAFAAFDRVVELAKMRGSTEPHHFVFPFRKWGNPRTGTYDPERHCTTCKSAWKQLTIAAGLAGLRPYDMRHTAITDILQVPEVSEETAKSIAGHISARILKTYSHIRLDAKREALDRLVRKTVAHVEKSPKSLKQRA